MQQVEIHVEHGIEVALQTVQRDRGRIGAVAGFDLGGARLEEVVHLVAGLGLGAAGAPDVAVERDQSDLGGRFRDRAAANASPSPKSAAARGRAAGR